MCHPGGNDHSHVVSAWMIVPFYIEAHRLRLQTFTHVPKNHFNAPLDEEHDIPLLLIVATPRIIARIVQKNLTMPVCRRCAVRNAWRMNVKTFGGPGEHSRSGPLLRP